MIHPFKTNTRQDQPLCENQDNHDNRITERKGNLSKRYNMKHKNAFDNVLYKHKRSDALFMYKYIFQWNLSYWYVFITTVVVKLTRALSKKRKREYMAWTTIF